METKEEYCEKRAITRFFWAVPLAFFLGALTVSLVGMLSIETPKVRRALLRDRLKECKSALVMQTTRAKGLKKCEAQALRIQEQCK